MISKKILISSVKIILYLDDFACLIVSNEKSDCEDYTCGRNYLAVDSIPKNLKNNCNWLNYFICFYIDSINCVKWSPDLRQGSTNFYHMYTVFALVNIAAYPTLVHDFSWRQSRQTAYIQHVQLKEPQYLLVEMFAQH